jgi:hypothetical protein
MSSRSGQTTGRGGARGRKPRSDEKKKQTRPFVKTGDKPLVNRMKLDPTKPFDVQLLATRSVQETVTIMVADSRGSDSLIVHRGIGVHTLGPDEWAVSSQESYNQLNRRSRNDLSEEDARQDVINNHIREHVAKLVTLEQSDKTKTQLLLMTDPQRKSARNIARGKLAKAGEETKNKLKGLPLQTGCLDFENQATVRGEVAYSVILSAAGPRRELAKLLPPTHLTKAGMTFSQPQVPVHYLTGVNKLAVAGAILSNAVRPIITEEVKEAQPRENISMDDAVAQAYKMYMATDYTSDVKIAFGKVTEHWKVLKNLFADAENVREVEALGRTRAAPPIPEGKSVEQGQNDPETLVAVTAADGFSDGVARNNNSNTDAGTEPSGNAGGNTEEDNSSK